MDSTPGTLLRASPIATACLLLGIGLLVLSAFARRQKLAHIPGIRYGRVPGLRSLVGTYHFMVDPLAVLKEGYERYPNAYFRVSAIGEEYVVVSSPDKLAEYLAAPDSVLNVQDAINNGIQFEWTMGSGVYYRPYHIPLIRGKLTQNVAKVMPGLQNELSALLDAKIGAPENWKEVPIHDVIIDIVARIGNLAFGGETLARHDEYIGIAIQYAVDLMVSAQPLRLLPRWAKPYANYLLPAYRSKKRCERIISPYIEQRLKLTDAGKPEADDMLQWLIDSAPPVERTVPQLVERLLAVNVAAIHTTTMSLTSALYTLCEKPSEYLPQLRAEVEQCCGSKGYTKESLDACSKLDSFLRECGRFGAIGVAGSVRYARTDFTFKDGTVVPAGMTVMGSTPALHKLNTGDASFSNFDGFRYSRLAEEGHKQPQAVTTAPDYLAFGHGKHACPGRHFAASELKLLFANLIQRYDMKLKEGTKPADVYVGVMKIPETKLPILVKVAGS